MKNKFGSDFESCLVLPPPPSENSDLKFCASFTQDKIFKQKGFTLAEILLSLSIIGIVAAIALPSLLGNVNERAFETQKKALYTRFSQSIPLLPSLNGYGQLEGTLSDGENEQSVTVDTASESFVRDGLSKVMKITNICDSEHLSDCGLPDKIITLRGTNTLNLSSINSLKTFNRKMAYINALSENLRFTYEQLDTKAASFETVNGESVLVYYNPNCEPNLDVLHGLSNSRGDNEYGHYIQPKMCANFVYDLNGKKGPNTVGKDIGVITAFYSTDPIVVAPDLYPIMAASGLTQEESMAKCKEFNSEARLPNIDELGSIFCNLKLFDLDIFNLVIWSSTSYSSTMAWIQNFDFGTRRLTEKSQRQSTITSVDRQLYCVKR